jgi:hypothetical protein
MSRRTFLNEMGRYSLTAAAAAGAMRQTALAEPGPDAGASGQTAATQAEEPLRLPEDLERLAGDPALLKKPEGLTVACFTFPDYHASAIQDKTYGKGWTEYNLMRTALPWYQGHQQPRGPLLGELDESLPSTWEQYNSLASQSGIDAFIWDWYWFDDQPVLHEALENGFLRASNTNDMKFACMWTNHDWGLLHESRNPDGTASFNSRLAKGMLYKGPHHDLKDCWRSLSYILSRYSHLPNYWKIDGEPVIAIWDSGGLLAGVGRDNAIKLLADLRDFARKLGHNGIHFHVTGFWSRDSDGVGFDSRGGYNLTLYAANQFQSKETEILDYGQACADAAFKMWPEGYKNSRAPYLPNVTPGWDTTPRYIKPEDWNARTRPDRKFLVFKNESPAAFKAFVQSAFVYLNKRPDVPRIMTIGVWNEWTEGQYMLPDNRFGYGMLDALAAAMGRQPAQPSSLG